MSDSSRDHSAVSRTTPGGKTLFATAVLELGLLFITASPN